MVNCKKNQRGPAAFAAGALIMFLAGSALLVAAQKKPAPALPSRISPKAQELLNHAIQALGGQAFLNFKNISTTGRAFAFSNGQMAGVEPYKSVYAPPDKRRFKYGKGKPVTLINNGSQGWELDRYGLIHQLPKDLHEWKIANRYGLDSLFRVVIKESGVLILDHGVDFISNQNVYVIDINDSRNVPIHLYLRKTTYLPLRITYRIMNSNGQDWDDYVDDYSDYQNVDGIETPMNIVRSKNGERNGAVYRGSAHYNVSVPANYFEPPR